MKELERTQRRRLRPTAVQQLTQPIGVDELLVVGQAIDRQRLVGGPLAPTALVIRTAAWPNSASLVLSADRVLRSIAIEDDLVAKKDAL
jgi:hypothetical protein